MCSPSDRSGINDKKTTTQQTDGRPSLDGNKFNNSTKKTDNTNKSNTHTFGISPEPPTTNLRVKKKWESFLQAHLIFLEGIWSPTSREWKISRRFFSRRNKCVMSFWRFFFFLRAHSKSHVLGSMLNMNLHSTRETSVFLLTRSGTIQNLTSKQRASIQLQHIGTICATCSSCSCFHLNYPNGSKPIWKSEISMKPTSRPLWPCHWKL